MTNIMLLKIGNSVIVREPDFYSVTDTTLLDNEELETVEVQLDTLLLSEDGHSPNEEQTINALLNKEKELLTAQQREMLTTLSGSLLKRISTQDDYSLLEIASSAKLSLGRLDELVGTVEQEMLYNYQIQCEELAQCPSPLQPSGDSLIPSDSSKCETEIEIATDSSTNECAPETEPVERVETVTEQGTTALEHPSRVSSPFSAQNESVE